MIYAVDWIKKSEIQEWTSYMDSLLHANHRCQGAGGGGAAHIEMAGTARDTGIPLPLHYAAIKKV